MALLERILAEEPKKAIPRLAIVLLALVCLSLLYLFIPFKGLNSSEAMDEAQLARNIAEGRGYQTDHIRPLSMWILMKHDPEAGPQLESHPDLVNPPVYPWLLAGWFKAVSPGDEIPLKKGEFEIYGGDQAAAVLGCILFSVAVLLLYFWVAGMLDPKVATLVVALVVFSDALWQLAISGTSWSLVFLWTILLGWLVYGRIKSHGDGAAAWLSSAGIGLTVGLGFLTVYSFSIWLIPAVLVVLLHGGNGKIRDAVLVTAAAALVAAPWILRNLAVSGLPLGLDTYSMWAGTDVFPHFSLMHAYDPNFEVCSIKHLGRKWFNYARKMWEGDLMMSGGNWMAAFFIVACFYSFKRPELQRVKWFAVYAVLAMAAILPLVWFPPMQGVTTQNLWPTLVPFFTIFGAVFFLVLLDRWELRAGFVYQTVLVIFVLLNSFGFFYAALGPKPQPYRYPPYFPPFIARASAFLNPEPVSIGGSDQKRREWMMADMPWAVAWYGRRPAAGLVYKTDEFYAIHDKQKEFQGLFFTPMSSHRDLVETLFNGELKEWMPIIVFRQAPSGFPLKGAYPMAPDYILLTDPARLPAPGTSGEQN